jgi:hypothetical protein
VIKAAVVVFAAAALFLTAVVLGRVAPASSPPPRAIELGARPGSPAGRPSQHRDRLGWTEVPARVDSETLR